ncbi:uncharacterized protein LOC126589040 [Malus sylvestris]|uniref:uncharacterized protein LOC126589040 n=1 Tax=Malus sylvestris TaxID=3752 RepID=UPI0021AD32D7|nr:uncharacterized protein LOC126589040 [Malus sylvestris]
METLAGSSITLFAKANTDKPLSPSKSLPGRSEIGFFGSRNSNVRVQHTTSLLRQKALQLVASSQTEIFTTSETAGIWIQPTERSETVRVQFQIHKECKFGESFLLVGNEPIIGQWNPSNAIPMNWSDGNIWNIELDVPTGIAIQYKFILKKATGDVLWQPGPDRILHTWSTKNTISIDEDWIDYELQKIGEVQITNENEAPLVNLDVGPIIPGNVTHREDQELLLNANKGANFTDKPASADEKPSFNSNNEVVIEEKTIKSADGTLLGIRKEVRVLDYGNSAVKEESITKSTPITLTGKISGSPKDEEDDALPTYEMSPVLVPSLTAMQAVSSEEVILPKGLGTPLPSKESPPIELGKSISPAEATSNDLGKSMNSNELGIPMSSEAALPKELRKSMSSEEQPKELGNLMPSEEALQKEFVKSLSSQAALPDQPMSTEEALPHELRKKPSSEEALPNELRKRLSTEEALPRELGKSMSFGEAPRKELGRPMTTYGSIGTDSTEKQNS